MKMRNRISRYLYLVLAWLFVLGILGQVYLVGLSLLGGRPSWPDHIDLGYHWRLCPADDYSRI
jgi:hypothetical protein